MRRLIPFAVAIFLLVSCGDDPSSPNEDTAFSPNMADIENEISDQWEEQAGFKDVEVSCPDPIEWRVGEEFHCTGSILGMGGGRGDPQRVTVYMENEDGAYTWQEG